MNSSNAPMFRVGRRARSGEWRPATKHRLYDDAEIVARGLVLGGEASETRIWLISRGQPTIVARVTPVKKFGADLEAVVSTV